MRQGSETPRVWTPPLRELTPKTSLGYSVIAFADAIGIWLYPWQRWLLIHMLELLDNGRLRFRTVVIIVGRQNGKSTLMKVLALWMMYMYPKRLVLGTAQDLETAEKLWEETVELAQDDPELAAQIAGRPVLRNGAKELKFKNRSHYLVKAPNRRAGRSKSANLVLLDELREHQSWEAWAALSNTTNAQEDGIVVAPSNAGDLTSVVLRSLRRLQHRRLGDPDGLFKLEQVTETDEAIPPEMGTARTALFEWSAVPTAGVWDRDGWAMANPALNIITPDGRNAMPESNIEAAAENADADADARNKFLNEVMCQWLEGGHSGPFPPGAWEAAEDEESTVPDGVPLVLGLDVSWDKSMAYIAWAALREDGNVHVAVDGARAGTDWLFSYLSDPDRLARNGGKLTIVAQGRGAPVSDLLDELDALPSVELVRLEGTDLGNATGRMWRLVKAALGAPDMPVSLGPVSDDVAALEAEVAVTRGKRIYHWAQPVLDVPATAAAVKITGDGAMLIDRRKSPVDAAPLIAAIGAVWYVTQPREPVSSAYDDHDLMIL